jgi:hypothetical protein
MLKFMTLMRVCLLITFIVDYKISAKSQENESEKTNQKFQINTDGKITLTYQDNTLSPNLIESEAEGNIIYLIF